MHVNVWEDRYHLSLKAVRKEKGIKTFFHFQRSEIQQIRT